MDLFHQALRVRAALNLLTDGILALNAQTGSIRVLEVWRRYCDARDAVVKLTEELAEVLAEVSR